MYARTHAVSVTTAADGSATVYSNVVNGRILAVRYVKTDFDNGSTITISGETTGTSVWTETGVNASATRAPRQPTHSQAGVAALYAAAGTAVNDYIVLADERIKIIIASGGNAKTGTFYFVVG